MIKVSVLYPNSTNGTFDIDYYCNTHLPFVVKLLGDALKSGSVDSGLAGGEPQEAPAYVAMGHMTFNSVEDFQESFGPHTATIMADLVNFTNITPLIQISEVKL
jgi:uncharacterized protein (TIGR02118 family)